MEVQFTPTQQRIMNLLSDGRPHTASELQACLHDELGEECNIKAHLTNIRKIIRPKGQDVICQRNGPESYYIHVRLIAPASASNQ